METTSNKLEINSIIEITWATFNIESDILLTPEMCAYTLRSLPSFLSNNINIPENHILFVDFRKLTIETLRTLVQFRD